VHLHVSLCDRVSHYYTNITSYSFTASNSIRQHPTASHRAPHYNTLTRYGNLLLLVSQNLVDDGMQWGDVSTPHPLLPLSMAELMAFVYGNAVWQLLLALYFNRVVPKDGMLHETDLLFCLRRKPSNPYALRIYLHFFLSPAITALSSLFYLLSSLSSRLSSHYLFYLPPPACSYSVNHFCYTYIGRRN
jgi:hypothetical protein